MITYTWEFPRFNAHPVLEGMSNVIYNIEFILSATDGEGRGAQIFGSVGLDSPKSDDQFTPFKSLTSDVIEKWVEAAMGAEMLADYKQNLENQISQQQTPDTVVLNKPW
jgi:hypothetical protein